jgi:hypothetical protein
MEHPKKVLGVMFISHDQTSEVLQPGKKPLDFPAPPASLQPEASFLLIDLKPDSIWDATCFLQAIASSS